MNKTLRMIFKNEEDRNSTISMADPVEELTSEQVEAVMQSIIDKNIFDSAGGDLTGKVRAQVVSRDVENIAEF